MDDDEEIEFVTRDAGDNNDAAPPPETPQTSLLRRSIQAITNTVKQAIQQARIVTDLGTRPPTTGINIATCGTNNKERAWLNEYKTLFEGYTRRANALLNDPDPPIEFLQDLIQDIQHNLDDSAAPLDKLFHDLKTRGKPEAVHVVSDYWLTYVQPLLQVFQALLKRREDLHLLNADEGDDAIDAMLTPPEEMNKTTARHITTNKHNNDADAPDDDAGDDDEDDDSDEQLNLRHKLAQLHRRLMEQQAIIDQQQRELNRRERRRSRSTSPTRLDVVDVDHHDPPPLHRAASANDVRTKLFHSAGYPDGADDDSSKDSTPAGAASAAANPKTTSTTAAKIPPQPTGTTKGANFTPIGRTTANTAYNPARPPPPLPYVPPLPGAHENPVLRRFQPLAAAQQHIQPRNPYLTRTGGNPNNAYLSLPFPWNVLPDETLPPVKEPKKLKGVAPVFDGRHDNYISWRQVFIPTVHRAVAPIIWKANALICALDIAGSSRIRRITRGADASEGGYAKIISRLERTFGHPQGVLGARLQALENIRFVRTGDYDQLEHLQISLEDYVDQLDAMQRPHDALAAKLYEDIFYKLDHNLAAQFQQWNAARTQHRHPNAITILAWLHEIVGQAAASNRIHQARRSNGNQPPRRHFDRDRRRQDHKYDYNNRPQPHRYEHRQYQAAAASSSALSSAPSDDSDAIDDNFAAAAGASGTGGASFRGPHTGGAFNKMSTTGTLHKTYNGGTTAACPFDGEQHKIVRCPTFREATPNGRRKMLRDKHLCYLCFQHGHSASTCTSTRRCPECQHPHHYLLHGSYPRRFQTNKRNSPPPRRVHLAGETTQAESDLDTDSNSDAFTCHKSSTGNKKTVLQTVPVSCINPANGKTININCMLDSGASSTFLCEKAAEQLGLRGHAAYSKVTGFGGKTTKQKTLLSAIKIKTPTASYHISVQVVKDPAGSYMPYNWAKAKQAFRHLASIDIKPPVPYLPVQLMLGQATPHLISAIEPDRVSPSGKGPVARLTPLGWTVGGPITPETPADDPHSQHFNFRAVTTTLQPQPHNWSSHQLGAAADAITTAADARLDKLLLRLIDMEDAMEEKHTSHRDEQLFRHLRDEMQLIDGRYQVPVLWKKFPPAIPNNYHHAVKRFHALKNTKQFKLPGVEGEYWRQGQDWRNNDFIEEVHTEEPAKDAAYYLPHLLVYRPDKASSKVRPVMDGKAKGPNKVCLNDFVYKGPKLINDLPAVLLRFRQKTIAVGADIEKMFHKITMPPPHRDYHRFLWQDNTSEPIKIYRWKSHVFGNAGSPCTAMFATTEHARRFQKDFPLAADTILHSTLVDDMLDSVDTDEQALELLQQLRGLLGLMSMNIKKVISNSPAVMAATPVEEASPALDVADFALKDEFLPTVKTLGVIYISHEDAFTFKLAPPDTTNITWTKRKVLQLEARLYDPHGLVLPHIVAARVFLQELWRNKYDWDTPLSTELAAEWAKWIAGLDLLPTIRIPRALRLSSAITSTQVHCFADASALACSACAYVVHTYDAYTTTSRLAVAKSKVAPLKQISIPRLELMAAILALDLAYTLTRTLNINMSDVHFWSDSTNVLCWLKNDSRTLNSFVGTRTAKIQRATLYENWRHVPSELNPADIPSRGALADTFYNNQLWWQGPAFLRQGQWPQQPQVIPPPPEALQEIKKGAQFSFIAVFPARCSEQDGQQPNHHFPLEILWKNMSQWSRILRTVALIAAWADTQLRNKPKTIAPQHLRKAEIWIWRQVQQQSFARTLHDLQQQQRASQQSSLLRLQPQLHSDGLIRMRGRTHLHPNIPYHMRHPIILPRRHQVVDALIRYHHHRLLHAGASATLAQLLETYWPVHARAQVKRVTTACVQCRRRQGRPVQPPMAPLPDRRIYPTNDSERNPFTHVGIDMAGPFIIRNARWKPQEKRYFLIITCFITRAVHLEPMQTASAPAFLNALQRFSHRRRQMKDITSITCDNGSNFRGAEQELRKLWNHNTRAAARQRFPNTKWIFTPPGGSHFGGAYERLIRATKASLHHALPQESYTTDDEFHTALVVVEGILNSRPLTYVDTTTGAPLPLTPADALGAPTYRSFAERPTGGWKIQKRWHLFQHRLDNFWQRFRHEIVPYLALTQKWHAPHRDVAIDDIVATLDDQSRGKWPLARVTAVEKGRDGTVRAVTIRDAAGIERRKPVRLLSLLLPSAGAH